VVSAEYQENGLDRLIHFYKYCFVENLHQPLGEIIIRSIFRHSLPLPNAIIPVPLHKRRLRWRGFNQSELLADYISLNLTPGLEIPVLKDSLIRKKYTAPQMEIKKYTERRKNMQNAFTINPLKSPADSVEQFSRIKNKIVLLVDDVATTGATLNECARILKQFGAKKVFAVVLARQKIKRK
jgi:competence protein ComFC